MAFDIITHPNKILRAKNIEIGPEEIKTEGFKRLVLDMAETMHKEDGIGLAAPQIGTNKRICVINTENGDLVLINPRIIRKSLKKIIDEEGCLSVPGIFGTVKRYKKIKVKALDINGREMIFVAAGMFARVIQHEVDHLDGVLFIDKVIKIIKGEIK
ncbi:MAG: peptide deformylase [Patescibacteria group bacterium]